MSDLIQKRTVLDCVGDDGGIALFMGKDISDDLPPTRLLLQCTQVEAMGRPRRITVTIQPGDELNDADIAFQTRPDAT